MVTYRQNKSSGELSRIRKLSAEARRCPRCGRGSALKRVEHDGVYGRVCRYADCGYENVNVYGYERSDA